MLFRLIGVGVVGMRFVLWMRESGRGLRMSEDGRIGGVRWRLCGMVRRWGFLEWIWGIVWIGLCVGWDAEVGKQRGCFGGDKGWVMIPA